MPERFECTALAKKVLYKYSSFPFLSSPIAKTLACYGQMLRISKDPSRIITFTVDTDVFRIYQAAPCRS